MWEMGCGHVWSDLRGREKRRNQRQPLSEDDMGNCYVCLTTWNAEA